MKKNYLVYIQYMDNTNETEVFNTKAEAISRKEYLVSSGYWVVAIKYRVFK